MHSVEQLCWRGLVDLNILYVFFVGDIYLNPFNVRCREYTLRYKNDNLFNRYWLTNFTWFVSAEKRVAYLRQKS